jgi:thymidylate kinase
MFSVALIGADGAGKTTVGRRLQETLPLPAKYLYMGVNLDSSNCMLPTTRLIRMMKRLLGHKPDVAGPPDPDRITQESKGFLRKTVTRLRSGLSLINRMCEEWFRQGLAWYYQTRGYVVVFDRHYFSDYYAYDIAARNGSRPLGRRIHGLMLSHFYPKPDLIIYLDAPAEVLFARKGEGTLRALEHRRQEYLQMRSLVKHFAVVDASQELDPVTREVSELIVNFYHAKAGETAKVSHVA